MSDETDTYRKNLRQKAKKIEHRARQQATYAEVALKRTDKDDPYQKQIRESREALISVGEQIDTLKAKIMAERRPIRENMAQAQQAVAEAESETERLTHQIGMKEQEIDKLSDIRSRQDAGLGEIVVADPEAKARMSALRVEVAGLYTALGTAKAAQADAIQARDELETEMILPVEADPRIAELYRNMEAETTALASLQSQVLGRGAIAQSEVLTPEEINTIIHLAVEKINTTLPHFLEVPVLRHAVQSIEAALGKYIPEEALDLMRDTRGITAGNRELAGRLTAVLDREVDTPMLDDRQKAALLRIVVPTLVEAMEEGKMMDSVLAEVIKEPSRVPGSRKKKKPAKKTASRSKKKVAKKARARKKS